MISRIFVSNGSLLTNDPYKHILSVSNIDQKIITNDVTYILMQMKDIYIKCELDEVWIDKLDFYNEQLSQQKIHFTFLNQTYELWKNKNIHDILLPDPECQRYLEQRILENNYRIVRLKKEISDTRKKLYSFLYFPLINCIEKIMELLKNHQCNEECFLCSLKKEEKWDLSQLILFVMHQSKLSILEFDSYQRWSRQTIFAHPIIQMCDEQIDTIMDCKHYSKNIRSILIAAATVKQFKSLETTYLIEVVKSIFYRYEKYPKQFYYLFYKILNPSCTGHLICEYLLGELVTNFVFREIGIQKSRKRKI
jgi:hypothetical protein